MANVVEDKQINANPLAANPDTCYVTEQNAGRYANLKKVEDLDVLKKKDSKNYIRFVCISDTHNRTEALGNTIPEGDVLIHSGDFTGIGARREIEHFNDFLGKVKHKFKHIIVIAGNHELAFDPKTCNKSSTMTLCAVYPDEKNSRNLRPASAKQLLTNCTYIEDETIELYGIKIFGSPWQPLFCDLAFNETRGARILEKWNKIPNDTNILMTHGPPLGIGDRVVRGKRVGCAELLTTIMERVRPKYHIFGHIHEDYGVWDDGQTTYINASIVNLRGLPVHEPIIFDYESPQLVTDTS